MITQLSKYFNTKSFYSSQYSLLWISFHLILILLLLLSSQLSFLKVPLLFLYFSLTASFSCRSCLSSPDIAECYNHVYATHIIKGGFNLHTLWLLMYIQILLIYYFVLLFCFIFFHFCILLNLSNKLRFLSLQCRLSLKNFSKKVLMKKFTAQKSKNYI